MTYKELLQELKELSNVSLEKDVTVYSNENDEFYKIDGLSITGKSEEQVLDEDTPFMSFD